ncbi:NAD-dependent epimerase/dehydratase family protein [Halobellus marinus]|uniref:NAD-dependent epimerase/dehydratase family protein n=1 Tax=Halobellus TaxID=1073986 RepID=UPI0028A7196B|nr:NAD(P)-dependent oxidoreductase [Halobellus sp. DFY28]
MADDQTVLITGGTGFIGSYSCRALLKEGFDVVAYDTSTDTSILEALGVANDVEVVKGDVTDPLDIVRTTQRTGSSLILHLAALLADAVPANPRVGIDVNICGTNSVFETSRILDETVERVVWASSAAVYAPPNRYQQFPVTEAELTQPDSLYGATKAYNESQANTYASEYDVTTVGLRLGLAYGPYRQRGAATFVRDLIEQPARGKPVSVEYGDQYINWQYIADFAQAFVCALTAPESALSQRVYNAGGEASTISEMADVVRSVLPDADITVSNEGKLPWTQRIDDSAARADLGYAPEYGLEEGVRTYVETLRE